MIIAFTMGGRPVHVAAGHVTHFYEGDGGGTKIWFVGGRDLQVDQGVAQVAEKLSGRVERAEGGGEGSLYVEGMGAV